MSDDFVSLTFSTNDLQKSIIEETLRDAGIEYRMLESAEPTAILGSASPIGFLEFQVSAERLKEAKDVLCASGVVCDVSERLFKRSMEDIVKPLLNAGYSERDYGRLLRFVELNNKETVRAMFEATLELGGGRELLEDLFFHIAREGQPGLLTLARVLNKNATASFADRFQSDARVGEKETRLALLEVLHEFSSLPWHVEVLAAALLDRDVEVRDAASEALFAIKGSDCGYDPEDPPAEREAAVQEILKLQR